MLFAGGGTGGHLYPALALAEAVRAQAGDVDVHFVGARRGVEARVFPARGVAHTLVPIEPVYRSRVLRNWRLVPSLVRSLRAISDLFRRFTPQLVVGTGGYASAPACLWAVSRRIPVAVQEQNAYPGMTTRLLSRWARQVHLGFPEAISRLRPGRDTRILSLGNPIRPPDPGVSRPACRAEFGLDPSAVVVLVVGGSQGSRALNEAVLGVLEQIDRGEASRPSGVGLLWAAGTAHFEAVRSRLEPLRSTDWVQLRSYIDDMPNALAAADIAVSRAGAMMTAELLAWGIPSILIPLPTAAADHQTSNARALEAVGAAVCIREASLTARRLWDEVTALVADDARRAAMSRAARDRARPQAARDIAQELISLLPAH